MTHTNAEKSYHLLASHPDYFPRICSAEEYASHLLPFIPRGLPVFQSHGVGHSQAIITYINQLLISFPLPLNQQEIFLLYLAAWFHDIGFLHPLSIHNRGRHPEISEDMIMRDRFLSELLSPEERENLAVIVRFHDTHSDLLKIRTSSTLKIPLLAGLFRLADAIDIGKDRCPPEVFCLIEDGLDEHSRRHWKAHQNVKGCVIAYPEIVITIYDPENPFFRRRIVPHLDDDCKSSGIICRKYGISPFQIVYHRDDDTKPESSSISIAKNRSFASASIQGQ